MKADLNKLIDNADAAARELSAAIASMSGGHGPARYATLNRLQLVIGEFTNHLRGARSQL